MVCEQTKKNSLKECTAARNMAGIMMMKVLSLVCQQALTVGSRLSR